MEVVPGSPGRGPGTVPACGKRVAARSASAARGMSRGQSLRWALVLSSVVALAPVPPARATARPAVTVIAAPGLELRAPGLALTLAGVEVHGLVQDRDVMEAN